MAREQYGDHEVTITRSQLDEWLTKARGKSYEQGFRDGKKEGENRSGVVKGVRLAGQTASDVLTNPLSLVSGTLRLIASRVKMPPHLLDLVESSAQAIEETTENIRLMRDVRRIVLDPTSTHYPRLDLKASAAPNPPEQS